MTTHLEALEAKIVEEWRNNGMADNRNYAVIAAQVAAEHYSIPKSELVEHETKLVETAARTAIEVFKSQLKQVGWIFKEPVEEFMMIHHEPHLNHGNCQPVFIVVENKEKEDLT